MIITVVYAVGNVYSSQAGVLALNELSLMIFAPGSTGIFFSLKRKEKLCMFRGLLCPYFYNEKCIWLIVRNIEGAGLYHNYPAYGIKSCVIAEHSRK